MNTTRSAARRAARTGAAGAAALVLSVTGVTGVTTAAHAVSTAGSVGAVRAADRTDDHDEADVAFAQQMIPHHRRALVMSRMALTHSDDPDIRALATRILQTQAREIDTMTGWLRAWGETVPRGGGTMDGTTGIGRDDDGATSMPGMMDGRPTTRPNGTTGRAFDTMFLTMMIEHHEDALDMAQTELAKGSYGPAKDLAADIIRTQTAEIADMRVMLRTD
ncbi:DUF305 domain-containing protein [Streptomyces sp. NPDC096136]|uniref:DUF305 domain-containing protein n=1 Tax=Streptomyces sp. NPDC096136 TaxID=3366076 RepID=UPI00381A0D40